MFRKQSLFGACVAAVVAVTSAGTTFADVFTIDGTSPTVSNPNKDILPGDVLGAGPLIHVPIEVIAGVNADDLDALSSGLDSVDGTDIIYFSVDRLSQGTFTLNTGDPSWDNATVNGQFLKHQQAGDIFTSVDANGVEAMPGSGMHLLMKNQRNFGLVPTGGTIFNPIGLPSYNNTSGLQDNVNGYSQEEFDVFGDDQIPDRPMFFSATAASPSLAGGSGADILVFDPQTLTVELFADYSMLGLQFADDIDGLALNLALDYDTGEVLGGAMYFSLTPGSPTLGTTLSPADVFMLVFSYDDFNGILTPFGAPFVRYDYASLGLRFEDNIDALETNAYIPEPTTIALLGFAGLALIGRARGRRNA